MRDLKKIYMHTYSRMLLQQKYNLCKRIERMQHRIACKHLCKWWKQTLPFFQRRYLIRMQPLSFWTLPDTFIIKLKGKGPNLMTLKTYRFSLASKRFWPRTSLRRKMSLLKTESSTPLLVALCKKHVWNSLYLFKITFTSIQNKSTCVWTSIVQGPLVSHWALDSNFYISGGRNDVASWKLHFPHTR